MDVWLWEMDMCCSMQLEELAKKLIESPDLPAGTSLRSGIASAPHDESLFDSMWLWLDSAPDGKLVLSGTVHSWLPEKGPWDKTGVIRSFDGQEDFLEWINIGGASEQCAEAVREFGR